MGLKALKGRWQRAWQLAVQAGNGMATIAREYRCQGQATPVSAHWANKSVWLLPSDSACSGDESATQWTSLQ